MAEKITINFDKKEIEDLQKRLKNTRWPQQDLAPPGSGDPAVGYGVQTDELKKSYEKWLNFDFDAFEKKLNKYDHYSATIDDLKIHYIQKKSTRPNAVPILLLHGWPQMFLEFLPVIDELAEPTDANAQAYDVIVPSHPGYFLSSFPNDKIFTLHDNARVLNELMVGVLRYPKYAVHGGDWGSTVARSMGYHYPESCIAVHVSFMPPRYRRWMEALPMARISGFLANWGAITPARHRALLRGLAFHKNGVYYRMQKTTPQTAAFGLTDSPIGLLAWIHEKTAKWGRTPIDFTVEICTLLWMTRSIGTSFHFYCFNPYMPDAIDPYYVPNLGYSVFPNEITSVSKTEASFNGKLNWYKEATKGGHYPAYEVPDEFLVHIREVIPVLVQGKLPLN